MKRINFILVLFALLTMNVAIHAEFDGPSLQESQRMDMEKVYVTPSQIFFSNQEIYVMLETDVVMVRSLAVDQHGIYTRPYWVCGVCGYPKNEFATTICRNCGWSRPF